LPLPLRFCPNCLNPNLTYIAGGSTFAQFDTFRIFGLALAVIVALLNIALGKIAGGLLGLFLAVTGLLLGAGIAVAFMVSITCTQQRSSFS
jgi:predicted RND superfamily exporter protein